MSKPTPDETLLLEAVRLLEYATFHDNRYGQRETEEWQTHAIETSKQINARLNRERYADVGPQHKGG